MQHKYKGRAECPFLQVLRELSADWATVPVAGSWWAESYQVDSAPLLLLPGGRKDRRAWHCFAKGGSLFSLAPLLYSCPWTSLCFCSHSVFFILSPAWD